MTRAWARLRSLPRANGGASMLEFALGLPLVLAMGGYGAELSNFAIVNQRINQAALQLADNGSRVGDNSSSGNLAVFQLREVDINDILQGARLIGSGLGIVTNGRITISSLENVQQSYDAAPVQRIHWQRCLGLRSGAGYDSSYGTAGSSAGRDATQANAGTATPAGMGDIGAKVNAPAGSGVIFVEVNYEYQPLFGNILIGSGFSGEAFMTKTRIHYTASFIVRDNRDFSQVFNPSPSATASTCDKHSA